MLTPGCTALPLMSAGTYSRLWSVPGIGGVVAVVGGKNQRVVIGQGGGNLRQPPVEFYQRVGVSCGIVAVAKFGIKINQVGKNKADVPAAL